MIVRFSTQHCFVKHLPQETSVGKLISTIEELGYQASVDKDAEWPDD